jgi:hypothetical protein
MSYMPEDYHRWNRYIKQWEVTERSFPSGLSHSQDTILSLRKFLGDNSWLAGALKNGHPIFRYLLNKASWSRWVLTRMAKSLDALKGEEGFTNLLRRIRTKQKFAEAQSVLEVAYKFHRAGLWVVVYGNKNHYMLEVDRLLTSAGFLEFETRDQGVLQAILNDQPLEEAVLIEDGFERSGMREFKIEILQDSSLLRCCISHRNEALNQILGMVRERNQTE